LVVNESADLLRELLAEEAPTVVTTSRPDRGIVQAVERSGRPFVLSAAPPISSAAHQHAETAGPVSELIREVMADTSALASLANAPGRLVIDIEAAANGADTIQTIAAHLGLTCDSSEAAAINARIKTAIGSEIAERSRDLTERAPLSREEELALEGALAGLDRTLIDGSIGKIVATRLLFHIEGSPEPPLGLVDATGRNRLLLYGPFLPLPLGDWTARCVYSFSPGLIGTPMSVDVIHFGGGFHELARSSFTITSGGRFDVNVRFVHTEPSGRLEVRLFNDRAVFDGTLSLGFIEFTKNREELDPAEDIFGETRDRAHSA
jgi:hypothetical protein